MTNVVHYPSYVKYTFFSRNLGKFTVIYLWMGPIKQVLIYFKRQKFINKNRDYNIRWCLEKTRHEKLNNMFGTPDSKNKSQRKLDSISKWVTVKFNISKFWIYSKSSFIYLMLFLKMLTNSDFFLEKVEDKQIKISRKKKLKCKSRNPRSRKDKGKKKISRLKVGSLENK